MRWFKNFKLRDKLLASFLLSALLTVLAGAVGAIRIRELASMQVAMYETEVVPIRQIGTAAWQAAAHYRRLYDYVVKTDPKGREDTLRFNSKGEEAVISALSYERTHIFNDRQKQLLTDFDTTWPAYLASARKVEEAARQGDQTSALQEMREKTDGLQIRIRSILIDFSNMRDMSAKARAEAGVAAVGEVTWMIAVCSVVGVGLALALGFRVTRSITREIGGEPQGVAQVVHQIALGNLDTRIHLRDDNARSVLSRTRQMQDSLRTAVSSIRASSESVSASSSEIAQANQDLSQRTEQHAASLEETASSMTQLTQTVKQNADNARQANALASNASIVVEKGAQTVEKMVQTMRNIRANSSKIAEITGVIEGIAFQTNILALNAAVEAARAGEQGRGFAVVAGEVRNLAQRSAAAAREIKELIGSSVVVVEDGSLQAEEAGITMTDVRRGIKRVSDIVSEIVAASAEQSRGIEQVNQAVIQMDDVSQQNAALVEQAAAAAQSLEEQAMKLKDAVAVFKFADDGATPRLGHFRRENIARQC
ncbi:methyl-accepting chemotaxis protein [Paraburkholderia madseniana]|uniref:Methyl-accepting chemotaxis protein n=1 Tax=Paraburkholderia madseniana TaxID=2599607 RepID=A0A6N6VYE0_9BURK|nr:methyl-accepting chemotaxis protein [Paraburkholderia madseniana]KAE8753607.1 methyl-accepting chemotaxis protein [Paraburkholderia madseniana]